MSNEELIVNRIIEVMNRLIQKDRNCMDELINHRVKCNDEIAQDETAQVALTENGEYTLGLFGVLSAIAGINSTHEQPGFSNICAVFNIICPEHGNIIENGDLKFGDNCTIDGCKHKLILDKVDYIKKT